MSDGKKYYCFCGSNCKYETMNKEQILAAITQAVKTGSIGDCDTGFITKVKETNNGGYVTFWVGTRAQYNALKEHTKNCFYIITDDTTDTDILAAITKAVDDANAAAESAYQSSKIAVYATEAFLSPRTITVTTSQALDNALQEEFGAMPVKSVRNFCVHVNSTENDIVFNGGITHITIRKSDNYGTIEAIRHGVSPTSFKRWVRNVANGIMMDWEWDNPAMELGVEYCTTERYNGKPVYVKRISLNRNVSNESNANVAMSITETGISSANTEIISMTGFALHPTYGAMQMPWILQGTGEVLMHLFDVTFGDAERKVELCYHNTKLPALSIGDLKKLECTLKYVKV